VLEERTFLDYGKLRNFSNENKEKYVNADPFPHILFDDLIPADLLRLVLKNIPSPDENLDWRKVTAKHKGGDFSQVGKLGMPHEHQVNTVIRNLLWEMNSGLFVRFLERLTGIENLIPDPRLQGGGVHQILPGGVLGVHADFTEHRYYKLSRRLNVLLYLNEDWKAEYGGHLELWSKDMSRCKRRIMPTLGRCVIFTTNDDSFHGHPQVLRCPEGMTRKSIALYYYTNGRSDEVIPTNATDWREAPNSERPPLE
jgi:hypothetical protein